MKYLDTYHVRKQTAVLPRAALALLADQWGSSEMTKTMNLYKQIRIVMSITQFQRMQIDISSVLPKETGDFSSKVVWLQDCAVIPKQLGTYRVN